MKKLLQNLTVILLVCAMLLSVTACRKNKETPSGTQSDSSDVSSVLDDTSAEDDADEEETQEDEEISEEDDSEDTDSKTTDTSSKNNTSSNKDTSSKNDTSSKKENTSSKNDTSSKKEETNKPQTPSESKPDSEDKKEEVKPESKVDADDKPYVKYPAYLEYPMKSRFDNEASALRDTILSAKDALPKTVTGNVWYVSNNGKDTNAGNSPEQAWGSIFAMNFNKSKIEAGDAVLFERGGVYRGEFVALSGVYYGAYGTGDKPCIYGSTQNYAKVSWTYKNANIWVCDAPFSKDIGTVVFNHGEFMGYKKNKNYDLENNGDFWCDNKNNYKLYMYMDENPSKKYKSIEIGLNQDIISIYAKSHDITIENLCIKYTGAHGIGAGNDVTNIIIRNCEMGFIGGSYLSGTLRYGNAIQLWQACNNILIENNWIYQIYDTGITHQGGDKYIAKDILMQKNLIEYCGLGSYEYWLSSEWDICRGENITFADNICRFAGYCWGGVQRPDKVSTHIRADVTCRNAIFNFNIKNNIFDQASENLLEIGGTAIKVENIPQNPAPVLSGNIYAQSTKGYLGTYFAKSGILFDDERETFINEYMGDKQAKVYTY